MEKFELSIDHPMLAVAKRGLDACLKAMVAKAISTRSMEGTATLKIGIEIFEGTDRETGELYRAPEIKFKANYSVPLKEGCDGTIIEKSRIVQDDDGGWMLVNGQITMDEIMEDQKNEQNSGKARGKR